MTQVVKKRNGALQEFDSRRIRNAIRKANKDVSVLAAINEEDLERVTQYVSDAVAKMEDGVDVEVIQDLVERHLNGMGLYELASQYSLYRRRRERARAALKVRTGADSHPKGDLTDQSMLLVQSVTGNGTSEWDRGKIAAMLMDKLGVQQEFANKVAKDVETTLLNSNLEIVGTELIRELVNNALIEHGYRGRLEDLSMYPVPKDFLKSLMSGKSKENSNIQHNNPEAVNMSIAELVLKQFALDEVFGPELKKLHQTGAIHLHDLGMVPRIYCGSHSLAYIAKYGLKGLVNLGTVSSPAKTAEVLIGHLNTFLASMQAYWAGALGIGYVDAVMAPYVRDRSDKDTRQVAQAMVFNCAQNAFSRGGQSLHPTERIWISDNGKLSSVEIGPFVDAIISSNEDVVRKDGEYEVVKTDRHGLETISFTRDAGRVLNMPVQYVARMPHKGTMYRIHTSNGIVNVTGDHSLFAYLGKGRIEPTKAGGLEVGDLVVVPHKVNLTDTKDTVNVLDYVDEPCVTQLPKEELDILGNLEITDSLAYDAGAYCASEEHTLQVVHSAIDGFKGRLDRAVGLLVYRSCYKDGKKTVPSWILTAPAASAEAFLEGYYRNVVGPCSSAGIMCPPRSTLSTSPSFISGLGLLSLRTGAESKVAGSVGDGPRLTGAGNIGDDPCYLIREAVAGERELGETDGIPKEDRNWLKSTDLSLSKIHRIEQYEYDGHVYDISVPGTEAFLGGIGNVFFKNTLFLDLNVAAGIPVVMKAAPAICPGGKYMLRTPEGTTRELQEVSTPECWRLLLDGKEVAIEPKGGKLEYPDTGLGKVLTYGDFEEDAQRFALAIMDVLEEGDANGAVFAFPKLDFHVDELALSVPSRRKVYDRACALASANGSTYFVFDRNSTSLASCCRLQVQVTDPAMFMHPERLRTVGFQNVTINMPQCAYRAKEKTYEGLIAEVDTMMDACVDAHLKKRAFIDTLLQEGGPLWQLGKPSCDGAPYVDLDEATYIIGLLGFNDAIKYLTGSALHESDEAMDMAIRLNAHMFLRCKELSEKHGLTFKLEESPAESAARRLAKADLVYYRDDALKVFRGKTEDVAYYTNSVHIEADAPVGIVQRIVEQSKFHPAIESGAIVHAFIGEEHPHAETIATLVEDVFLKTQCAQLTISPEFTTCNECGHFERGLHDKCPECGSTNVDGITRVVGYYSRISAWNDSKRGELEHRHMGDYGVKEDACS
jgi:anaerobic ribonucleoside-triphosphate reductase